jgi:large conductance mechanosensitive channel
MIQGFRDFILRGNVVELAIAVVIGTAFSAMVNTFVSAIITPVVAAVGSPDAGGWGFAIRPSFAGGNSADNVTWVDLGGIVNAVVVFFITALVVYFVFVVPMNKYNELVKARLGAQEEEVPAPTDVELLGEIRDLLKAQQGTPGTTGSSGTPTA